MAGKYGGKAKIYTNIGATYVKLFGGDDLIGKGPSKICKIIGIYASGFDSTGGSIAIGTTAANAVPLYASDASGYVAESGLAIIIDKSQDIQLWALSTTATDDPSCFITYEIE